MSLRIADPWIWDFWTVTQGPDVHAVEPLAPPHFGGRLAPFHRVWLDAATAGHVG